MIQKIKYHLGKNLGLVTFHALKIMPTGGKSFPGLMFINIAGEEAITDLSKNQIEKGSILITGTNGKTTTTTMIIKILSQDLKLSSSVGNNTINALTTGLLRNKAQLGVFEYGIRDLKHGIPDRVSELIQPIGVIYTNISREHTQVAGVKNPFKDYVKAKTLLSQSLTDGILITNADDPNTAYIGQNKEADNHVIYYGLQLEDYEDIFEEADVSCPKCDKKLEYTKHYINQRGIYQCSCGFKRPEPNVKITKLVQNTDSSQITVEVDAYNLMQQENIKYTLDLNLEFTGLHNLYNTLTTIAAYTAFTTNKNIKEGVINFFNNYQFTVPPGRFEILNINGKKIGVGQGDNGDALQINALLMNDNIEGELEFIYTTPDTNEEEIFDDHRQSIKALNPENLIVLPGRTSIETAQNYYHQIEDQYNSEFYPIEFDFETRINKIIELIQNSQYDNIMISGCGEEIVFWDALKQRIKQLDD